MGMGRQMPPTGPRPPVKALAGMTLHSSSGGGGSNPELRPGTSGSTEGSGKKKDKEKKMRNLFGLKK
jgi:syntaxin-binding protein 1